METLNLVLKILQWVGSACAIFIACYHLCGIFKGKRLQNKIKREDKKAKEAMKEQLYLEFMKNKELKDNGKK